MGSAGPRVGLTRSREDNQALALRLQAAGVDVVELPTASFINLPWGHDECAQADGLLDGALAVCWTSRHGVRATAAVWPEALDAVAARRVPRPLVGVVGQTTANEARGVGAAVDVLPDAQTGAALGVALDEALHRAGHTPWASRGHVLILQAAHGRPELEAALSARGWQTRRRDVYRNAAPPRPSDASLRALSSCDLVYLAAPSAADRLAGWGVALRELSVAVIGPTTAAHLRSEHGIEPAAVAEAPQVEAVCACLLAALGRPNTPAGCADMPAG
jgi:uroporphyrinogen-III synthase